jgi:transcriptional regulator with XRE-family HTH domain
MLGDRILRRRRELNLTQAAVAEKTGLKQFHISRIESGDIKDAKGDTLRRLAEALDCSTDYLVGLTDDPQPLKRRRRKADDVGDYWPTMAGVA